MKRYATSPSLLALVLLSVLTSGAYAEDPPAIDAATPEKCFLWTIKSGKATVHGALVVEQGITCADGAELELPGDALPNIERERVPGFRRSGVTRPGMLTLVR